MAFAHPRTMIENGTRLGNYEILEPVGKGGMGEVYRARDLKLKREVAIKVLPEDFAADTDRMARFEREAELLASLNHPHIAAIYGFEDAESCRFIVLELVPGETLADILKRGPLPFEEAVEIASQIAEAVAAAHDSGVIHRDLKPANVKITPDGDVKILDFGLAKAFTNERPTTVDSSSPTLSANMTGAGAVLGTAAYMSPEQARGRPVDKRTDVFAFGALLYEMLTGRQLFRGEDVADTMASVIKSDPDLASLPAPLPPGVRELLARCLEKDPRKRWRDIGDVGFELRALLTRPGTSVEVVSTGPVRRVDSRYWAASAFAAIFLSVVVGAVVWRARPTVPRPVRRFEIGLYGGLPLSNPNHHALAISPLGTHLVYNVDRRLYVRRLDQSDAVPLPGTENAREPFFSADGAWVGFWADGALKKVPTAGGATVTLCETDSAYGASWSVDDSIVFSRGKAGIFAIPATGGAPQLIVEGGEHAVMGPRSLNESTILFTRGESSIWDEASIVAERLDTGERKVLVEGGTDGRYVASGHLVYAKGTTLFAVPFDPDRLEVRGTPVRVLEGVMAPTWGGSGASQFDVSQEGSLVFAPAADVMGRQLLWADRRGDTSPVTERRAGFARPRLSPDGTKIALWLQDGELGNIGIYDVSRDTLSQLTNDGRSRSAEWSPDGEWLVYTALGRGGDLDLYRIRTDFTGMPELILERPGDQYGWYAPDGSGIIFQDGSPRNWDIWWLPFASGEAVPIVELQGNASYPTLSPDNRWLAYHANLSGPPMQVWIQPFPGPGARRQISTDGGNFPRWSSEGEIFYQAGGTHVTVVEVRTEPQLEIGSPGNLFDLPPNVGPGSGGRNWDVTRDGDRFVIVVEPDPGSAPRPTIQFVTNWVEELERLVPTR